MKKSQWRSAARTALSVILAMALAPMLLLMGGCATPIEAASAMADAHAQAAKVRTIEAECTGPCKISYTDPRDRAQMRLPTNGWDAVVGIGGAVERIVTGAVLPAAGVAIVREVRRAGSGGDVATTTTTTTTSTASGDGASTGGAGNWHWEQVGPDSNNHGDTVTTTTDNTSTPTVVIQPAPVVVRPEIVQVP